MVLIKHIDSLACVTGVYMLLLVGGADEEMSRKVTNRSVSQSGRGQLFRVRTGMEI